jgi:hypothetical protein
VSINFTPSVVTGTSIQWFVTAQGFARAGSSDLTILATSPGIYQIIRVPITVVDFMPPWGYLLSVETPVTLRRGGSADSATVHVARALGFTVPIDLAVANLPPGVTAQFLEDPLNGVATTVVLQAHAMATLGLQSYTVSGVASGIPRSVTAQIQIIP